MAHHPQGGDGGGTAPNGTSLAAAGVRLDPATVHLDPGEPQRFAFRVLGADGEPVTAFEPTHEALAHLVVVRRDLTRFQHRHPEFADDGTWTVDLTLPDPGVYRAFLDVSLRGDPVTLGVDLFASGDARYRRPGRPARTATVGEYTATVTDRTIPAGEPTRLTFAVTRDGVPVDRLAPYLGARGHLVALRAGDLAYLHVHPLDVDVPGEVAFEATFPTPGPYRLFLETRPDGNLTTAAFDVAVGGEPTTGV